MIPSIELDTTIPTSLNNTTHFLSPMKQTESSAFLIWMPAYSACAVVVEFDLRSKAKLQALVYIFAPSKVPESDAGIVG